MSLEKPPIPNQAQAITADGKMEDHFRFWVQKITDQALIVGTGSPEGVVTASQYTLYIDETTPATPVQYRKMLTDIAGDRSQGWIAL